METLLGNSVFFIYIFAIVSVINYSELSSKQKISVVYLLTYGIEVVNTQIGFKYLMVTFFMSMFFYEEYWNADQEKGKWIKSIHAKIIDYLIRIVSIDKALLFVIGLLVKEYKNLLLSIIIPSTQNENVVSVVVNAVSFAFVVFSIHCMISNPIELFTFDEIISNVIHKNPYYKMVENECGSEKYELFRERVAILTEVEDRCFFDRTGYTFLSGDYIKKYFNDKKYEAVPETYSYIGGFLKFIHCKGLKEKRRLLRKFFGVTKRYIATYVQMISRASKSLLLRGNSTIEMQLFRILIYKRGLLMGKPKKLSGYIRIIRRKLFELVYTPIFFSAMKKYLLDNGAVNLKYYREYIVYLYFHSVISWYKGQRYMPMSTLFVDEKGVEQSIHDWDKEKLFIEILGLPKVKVTEERIYMYENHINRLGLDIDRIIEMVQA